MTQKTPGPKQSSSRRAPRHQAQKSAAPAPLTPKSNAGAKGGGTTGAMADTGGGLDGRIFAYRALDEIFSRQIALDAALEGALGTGRKGPGGKSTGGLDPRDRSHGRLLTMTVLRHLGQIDAALSRFLTRQPSGKGRGAITILRMGVAQLLFLETPPHAAVATSVALADKMRLGQFKGLINAVLRRVADAAPHLLKSQDAARLNTPDWLWQRLTDTYGVATARAVAESHLQEPPLDVTLKAGVPDALRSRLSDLPTARRMPTGSIRLQDAGAVSALPGYRDGEWWVQDAAAALPAGFLINALPQGARVGDLCAAPGGKTAQLMDAGFRVTALDNSGPRLARLSENMKRLGFEPDVVEADALTWRPDELFDGILLDAPCSATGTVRRHPDLLLKWHMQGEDAGKGRDGVAETLAKLQEVQISLGLAAADMLKPGGVLIFVTCSLFPEEGEDVLERLLGSGRFELMPLAESDCPGLPEAVTEQGCFRSLPSFWRQRTSQRAGGIDGFFAARLKRV